MTTYCRNRLTVTGPGDALESFVARVQTDERPLSLETLAPTPQELLKSGWYEWRIEHWGTKWDAEFEDIGEPLVSGHRRGPSLRFGRSILAAAPSIPTGPRRFGPRGRPSTAPA